MGTQQELTTEQVEVLLWTKSIEDFDKINPGNIPMGGIKEVLDSNNIMEPDIYDKNAKVLNYYGYLKNGDELSIDGKQYIDLFIEYIEQPEKQDIIISNSYSWINIGKLEVNLEACLTKMELPIEIKDIASGIKCVVQKIKKVIHK